MKSFGSVLNTPGSSLGNMNQSTGLWKSKKNTWLGNVSNKISSMVGGKVASALRKGTGSTKDMDKTKNLYDMERDIDKIYNTESIYNISSDKSVKSPNEMYSNMDIFDKRNQFGMPYTEDTTKWDQSVIDQMNWYNYAIGAALNSFDVFEEGEGKDEGKWLRQADVSSVVHSLFNPYMGITPQAMLPGQYIVAQKSWGENGNSSVFNNLGDCRISTLVNMSRYKVSLLGQARYKYADFMFCKELGMPNNHLITLRRYASPVGDMIHGSGAVDNRYYNVVSTATGIMGKGTGDVSKHKGVKSIRLFNNSSQVSDIGHMCCYFGGEDNKLEDILKYSFKSTYKEMNSEIQRKYSEEDSRESPLGMLINSTSRGYASHMLKGDAGMNNIVKWGANEIGGKIGSVFGAQPWYHKSEALYHVDKNKIYEPKNTIQQMDYYEGKLQFTHEFTLVFSYKLRAYDNISPKAAMLDLLANILQTTYNRGRFWGGAKQINGPQPNPSAWNKANSFIDNTWDKLGSGIATFLNGGVDFSQLLGNLSSMVSGIIQAAGNVAKDIVNQGDGSVKGTATVAGKKLGKFILEWNKKLGISDMLKGSIKDALGRPQLYAWDSLLTGDNTGMWHLTIGNPLQPIVTIGNLEVTNTEIQHLGPLGIDDFPTELKVTVSLKHARPRDSVSIEKMYMMGAKRIYKPHIRKDPAKIYNVFTDQKDVIAESKKNDNDTDESSYQDTSKPSGNSQTSQNSTAGNGSGNRRSTQNPTQKPAREQTEAEREAARRAAAEEEKKRIKEYNEKMKKAGFEPNSLGQQLDFSKIGDVIANQEFGGFTNGLEYIGEFDYLRMKANMDELA